MAQDAPERVQTHRLGQHFVHAGGETRLGLFAHRVGGAGHDRHPNARRFARLGGTHLARKRITVHDRHLAIAQHQCVVSLVPQIQCLLAIDRNIHLAAQQRKLALDHGAVYLHVLRHQHPRVAALRPQESAPRCRHRTVAASLHRPGLLQRLARDPQFKQKRHRRAAAEFTRQRQRAAHHVHQSATNDQSEAAAAKAPRGIGFRLHEGLKQARLILRKNADTGVFNLKAHQLAHPLVAGQHRAHHNLAMHGELDGITDQVEQNLLQPVCVE